MTKLEKLDGVFASYDENGLVQKVFFDYQYTDNDFDPEPFSFDIEIVESAISEIKHLCPYSYDLDFLLENKNPAFAEAVVKSCFDISFNIENSLDQELQIINTKYKKLSKNTFTNLRIWIIDKLLSAVMILVLTISIAVEIGAQEIEPPFQSGWTVNDNCFELADYLEFSQEIPSELTVAMYQLESGHGKNQRAIEHHNYFGIFYASGEFMRFESKVECFLYWGSMMRRVYDNCLDQDIIKMTDCIGVKYCPDDPQYSSKIIKLIQQQIMD